MFQCSKITCFISDHFPLKWLTHLTFAIIIILWNYVWNSVHFRANEYAFCIKKWMNAYYFAIQTLLAFFQACRLPCSRVILRNLRQGNCQCVVPNVNSIGPTQSLWMNSHHLPYGCVCPAKHRNIYRISYRPIERRQQISVIWEDTSPTIQENQSLSKRTEQLSAWKNTSTKHKLITQTDDRRDGETSY